jgi:hypothetical protein
MVFDTNTDYRSANEPGFHCDVNQISWFLF